MKREIDDMWFNKNRFQYVSLIVGFILISLGISTTAFYFNKYMERAVLKQSEHELSGIADLKVSQVTAWRNDRFAEAQSIRQNPFVNQSLVKWLKVPGDSMLVNNIRQWMLNLEKFYGYSEVAIVDPDGSFLLPGPGGSFSLDSAIYPGIHDALAGQEVLFCDLYKSKRDGEIHFDAILPIDGHQKTMPAMRC